MPCDDDNVAIFPFIVDIFFYCYYTVTFVMMFIIHIIMYSQQHIVRIRFHVRDLKNSILKNHNNLLWQDSVKAGSEVLYIIDVLSVFIFGRWPRSMVRSGNFSRKSGYLEKKGLNLNGTRMRRTNICYPRV